MDITFDDFLASFDERTLDKGLALFRREKIRAMDIQDDGKVSGIVQGSRRQPYRQTVWADELSTKKAKVTIVTGICSCPMQRDCKHVAAVLFELFATLEADAQRAAAREARTAKVKTGAARSIARNTTEQNARTNALDHWFAHLPQAISDSSVQTGAGQSSKAPEHLLYLLCIDEQKTRVSLRLEARPLLKSGLYSTRTRRSFELSRFAQHAPLPAYIDVDDHPILSHLLAARLQPNYQNDYKLEGDSVVEALQLMLETGRTFKAPFAAHGALEQLEWGEAETLDLRWVPTEEGTFHLRPEAGDLKVISLNPPLYLHTEFGIIGKLASPVAAEQLQHLQLMPEVTAEQLDSFAQRLQNKLGVPVPKPVQQLVRRVEAVPRVVLFLGKARYRAMLSPRVHSELQQHKQSLRNSGGLTSTLLEQEEFCFLLPTVVYEDVLLDLTPESVAEARESSSEHSTWVDGQHIIVQRDLHAEQVCLDELQSVGLRPLSRAERLTTPDELEDVLTFSLMHEDKPWIDLESKVLPRWESKGWNIEYSDDFPFANIVMADDSVSWFNDLQPSEDGGLLLGIGIEIDGVQYDLLPCLIRLMSEYTPASLAQMPDGTALPVVMADGTRLYLPVERVRSLIGALHDLFDFIPDEGSDNTRLHIQPQDMVLLDDLDLESRHHESVLKLRMMIDQLRQPSLATAPALPESFQATLRQYQTEGVGWLQLLRQAKSGGILADDMGLGKTIQTLAHLCIEKAEGRLEKPALLVVPTSLITNWRAEAAQFAPTLRLLVLHGPDRHGQFEQIEQSDLVITTYPLILRDVEKLEPIAYSQLILDEAQAIKNARARVTQHLGRFLAQQRICLTGTPLENHLGELWSQFNFLNPGLLRDESSFSKQYRKPIEQHGDASRQRALHARIAPFILRRTKREVATELPPKNRYGEARRIQVQAA